MKKKNTFEEFYHSIGDSNNGLQSVPISPQLSDSLTENGLASHQSTEGSKALIEHSQALSVGAISGILGVAAIAQVGLGDFRSASKSEDFARKVTSLAHSNDFVAELSSKVGIPREDETEDMFVHRAKEIMRNLLRSKLE